MGGVGGGGVSVCACVCVTVNPPEHVELLVSGAVCPTAASRAPQP